MSAHTVEKNYVCGGYACPFARVGGMKAYGGVQI
jgi:hypothetical protein